MADNVGYTPGSGATVAADEITGVLHQRVKISVGADGEAADLDSGQATSANSLPVVVASDQSAIEVVGDAAHDAPVAGNPLLQGAYAANAMPTAVANGDVARLISDLYGRLITAPYAPPEKFQKYTSPADITDTSDDAVFSAVASVKHYITHFSAMCSHATVGTWVYLKDGSTVIYSGYCAPAGGGFVATFPIPLVGTANTAINVANATTSSAVRVNVSGYQAP